MRTGLSQHTSLRQELRVNPRLYQAMDMLYMPMMDLQQHLKQELLANPFLELLEPEEETTEQPAAEEQKEQKEKEEEVDWEEILLNGFEVGGTREQYEQLEYTEPVTVETRNLIDHLREQLQMLTLTPRQLLLAEEFLGNINEEGYLAASLEEILGSVNQLISGHAESGGQDTGDPEIELDEYGAGGGPTQPDTVSSSAPAVSSSPSSTSPSSPPFYTMEEAEEMLAIVQRLDPSGTGARDLRECLLIQLTELADTESLTYRLVAEAFPDLIAHRWNDLAKRFSVEPAAVQAAADQLSRLDPKPGLKYSEQSDGYIIPDLIVEKIGGRYQVFLNDTGMPRLRLSRSYQEIARDKKKMTPENREFIASKMNSANWMIQAIEQRRQTMLKVMNFIVDRQRDFFEKGIEYLKPLTLREVAEVINMHESTVSRVTNEKYVQTPRGVLPLKFFFSSALSTASGEDASARSIRAKLEKMVSEENSAKPLTDQQIVHLFQEQGIQIARRTVAKYRDQLGILPARMRKRV
ncbi:MAG TPA: RNA polymerase factor sigma-54 [Gemmatimonadales bacterium]|jgi:RNA polymerase sigma-54 factor|nr:RNA polymerase factor sigma-54 [Gemmatimonadales bacterium]